MEFYVVDPKEIPFADWSGKMRDFFAAESMSFTESTGDLYYVGDDVAVAWDEASVLFTVDGDEGGVVEVRDIDRNFYVFADDLDLFDEREVRDSVGYRGATMGVLYGFDWNSENGCRFHAGPSIGNRYFCFGHDTDVPPALHLEDVWAQFFRALYWIGGNTSRLQDLKGINVEKVFLDLEVSLDFKHPASLEALFEILVEEDGYERTKSGLRAVFRDRDVAWVQRFVSLLPTAPLQFDKAFFRAVWRGLAEGENKEVYYIGVERRNLKPFVQLPLQRTSKAFMEKFRAHFKGHRIDRQEYNL